MNPTRSSSGSVLTGVGVGIGLACAAGAITTSIAILGVPHTLIVLAVLVGVSLLTAAGTEWVIRTRGHSRSGPLSRQLAIVIAVVIAPLLVTLLILGLMMFVSDKDATLVGVIVVLSGLLGIAAAARLSRTLTRDVAAIRDRLMAVGQGERRADLAASAATELRELADSANAMIDRLAAEEAARDQSESARRNLVAAASHDLRTPITSLQLLAAAIDDELVDEQVRREYVRRMLTHIEALSALIDDLFELSRLEAGDISWSLEQVAMGQLVSETVDAMRVQADARGIAVTADLPEHLAPARGNPEKLQRVLFNLIQNAIRHSPADGTIVVRAETLSDMIEVEVEDRGAGIPAPERELVFEAFYRGGTDAPRSTNGAGLGLAVARAIVDAHGGQIWLPATQVGTRVRFSVPTAG
ncbi:MAG TPA: HAMP domain-containing sensor histidine kinase [Solirubrobacteraceae bacterium]|jgi:signal transduction histidine kinase|nr:HAMP domain-containing sensor histidine kinase [Solirubrobacteraceae bacterium]